MEFLYEYEFDIKHKGNENNVFDALSRNIHVIHVANIYTITSYLKDKIIEASVTYEFY